MRYCELKQKEVINLCDGRRLGCVTDAVIDSCGRVDAIIVPGQAGFSTLFKGGREVVIPWCRIVRLGDDVILVDADGTSLKKA